MAKENLEKERSFMEFVERCTEHAFPNISSPTSYFEKSLFLRICAGQQNLKRLFFSGFEDKLITASYKGAQYFFITVIVLDINIPKFLAILFFKAKMISQLVLSLTSNLDISVIQNIKNNDNKIFLSSNLSRCTKRFRKIFNNVYPIIEVNLNSDVKIVYEDKVKSYKLPRITWKQMLALLTSSSWKMTYLIRAYRQYNLMKELEVKVVYIMDGDAPSHVSTSYAAWLSSAKSIGVQWGAMPNGVKPGYKQFPFDEFYCTGKWYVSLLNPFSKRTIFFANGDYTAEYKESSFVNRDKSLLFLFEESEASITKEECVFMINLCIETKVMFPHLNVTARSHPAMILDNRYKEKLNEIGVVVENYSDPDIALMQHKFLVGHVSSLMIESLKYDCMPIFMDIGIEKMYPDLIGLSAAKIFKTKKEWFNILQDLLVNYSNYIVPVEVKKSLFENVDI